jgi:hypothetical protein
LDRGTIQLVAPSRRLGQLPGTASHSIGGSGWRR